MQPELSAWLDTTLGKSGNLQFSTLVLQTNGFSNYFDGQSVIDLYFWHIFLSTFITWSVSLAVIITKELCFDKDLKKTHTETE